MLPDPESSVLLYTKRLHQELLAFLEIGQTLQERVMDGNSLGLLFLPNVNDDFTEEAQVFRLRL